MRMRPARPAAIKADGGAAPCTLPSGHRLAESSGRRRRTAAHRRPISITDGTRTRASMGGRGWCIWMDLGKMRLLA